jgi:type VI secretion system protein VasG
VFEEGTFVPTARITDKGSESIVTDYLGTPVEAYNEEGNKVWEREIDIYGRVRKENLTNFVPFLYQGQYVDVETGLAYNRFRYYDCDTGNYISQDPIGLAGGNPTLYGYVHDPNSWIDYFGLDIVSLRHYTSRSGLQVIKSEMVIRKGDQGAVFATRAKGKPLSPADAADKFKIKQSHATSHIDFDIDSSRVEFRTNDLGVKEYKIKGDIELELDAEAGKYKAKGTGHH